MKKALKKVKAFVLTFALAIGMLQIGNVNVSKAALVSGFWQYDVKSDGTIKITKYTGGEENVKVPSSLNGKKVTEIGGSISNSPFKDDKWLKTIKVPSTVTVIGEGAFTQLEGLTSVTGLDNVTVYGAWAFEGLPNLKTVNLGTKIKKISFGMFKNSKGLERVVIPSGVNLIEADAFYDCTALKSIEFPDNALVKASVCSGCISLESAVVGKNTTLETAVFKNCKALKNVTIKAGSKPLYFGGWIFGYCSSLEEISFPGNIRSFGNILFENATSLKKVTFKHGTLRLGSSTFEGCSSLETVNLPDTLETIENGTFRYCNKLSYVKIPKSVTYVYVYADKTNTFGKNAKYGVYAGTAMEEMAKKVNLSYEVLPEVPATSVKINGDRTFNMFVGESKTLSYAISPSNTTDAAKFMSSDESILKVNNMGEMEALKKGTVTVRMESTNGKSTSVNVTVVNAPTSIKMPFTSKKIAIGHSVSVKAKAYEYSQLRKDVIPTYKSSNPKVATVSKSGKVKALKPGKTTITASACGLTAKCTITVKSMIVTKSGTKLKVATLPRAKVKVIAAKRILGRASKTVTATRGGVATVGFKKPIKGVTVKIEVTKKGYPKYTKTIKYR